MGEFANYQGERIKIGTCEAMYYLRLEDVAKVEWIPGNVNAARDLGLWFRLPYPDEDTNGPGNYGEYNRGARLYRMEDDGTLRGSYAVDYSPEWLKETEPGRLQMSHPSGLLISVPCHHGLKLPDLGPDVRVGWNGKTHSMELYMLKRTAEGVLPLVRCRHCESTWRASWDEVLPFVGDKVLRERLSVHAEPYYVTDSRSLQTAGPLAYAEAIQWLGDACERRGMSRDDWKHPEYWGGTEPPPSLYTETEWEALQ